MDYLFSPMLESKEYISVKNAFCDDKGPIEVIGPSDSQKAHFAASLLNHSGRRGVYIAFNELQANRLYKDFNSLYGDKAVFFPARELKLLNIAARSRELQTSRICAMDRILCKDYDIIITSVEAVSLKTMPVDLFRKLTITVSEGDVIQPDNLILRFMNLGYERVPIVEGKGQFAVRGSIIDIYPMNCDSAVRIDFFDTDIDSVRLFNPETQRSIDSLKEIRIAPACEILVDYDNIHEVCNNIKENLKSHAKKVNGGKLITELKSLVEHDLACLNDGIAFPGIDAYMPFIYEKGGSILDYTGRCSVFIDEPARFRQRHDNILSEYGEDCRSLIIKGKILPEGVGHYFERSEIEGLFFGKRTLFLSGLGTGKVWSTKTVALNCRQISSYRGHMDLFREDLDKWTTEGIKTVVMTGSRERAERLSNSIVHKPGVIVTDQSIGKGFMYPDIGLAVVSGSDLYDKEHRRQPGRKKKMADAAKINSFVDLKAGDYVVHEVHGIGRYVGIESADPGGVIRDYIKIAYQDNGFLYLPTDQLEYIQKYIGSDGRDPKINKLGGSEWSRVKNKVKKSLMVLAAKLIELYAKREQAEGFAFSKDTIWQRQFEEMFPFEETEDQLKSAEEIKRDMETPKPMDRLLCGDVGYGKTEVALRALFKAVMDGRQVAFLCPTTVLAQQHYMNFIERLKDFPVTVDVLSRFKTKSEQQETLKRLREGKVDVVVGTHRILSDDVSIPKLGLLIVDEEQRFGVKHKERIKELAPQVDVLTLTATPIPRTLHMSMTGIRDISLLETPPEERYPVQTYVMEYDESAIDDAIIREAARGGQVFYLCNRVRTININADTLRKRLPDISFAVAHGQMNETELEDIMQAFITGHYDVLVCTTIIESGLDMPNVNTIIVENAERLGLSQLYQIRGRVGRSNKLGYAYITYKKNKILPEQAEKRLQAIKEFTEFGSGFKVAMRDLEIRGAGNLLGPEQHGSMETVGYDMYCKLLDEAVQELSGGAEKAETQVTAEVEIGINAFLSTDYVVFEEQRVEIYRKILSVKSREDVMDVRDELIDRFGEPPKEADMLINISLIKALAEKSGVSKVSAETNLVTFHYAGQKDFCVERLGVLLSEYQNRLKIDIKGIPKIILSVKPATENAIITEIISFLELSMSSE